LAHAKKGGKRKRVGGGKSGSSRLPVLSREGEKREALRPPFATLSSHIKKRKRKKEEGKTCCSFFSRKCHKEEGKRKKGPPSREAVFSAVII